MAKDKTRGRVLDLVGWQPTAVGQIASTLGLSTQAVLHHLNALRDEGFVRLVGQGRSAKWERSFSARFQWSRAVAEERDESALWAEIKNAIATDLADISEQTLKVLDYTVTEILNNAIDHSEGSVIAVQISFEPDNISVIVIDDGIGAFRKVREHFKLPNDLEAIAHIAKGQQTTAPSAHSGQGLYFSSRMVDFFEVEAVGRLWKVDNLREDSTVASTVGRLGTRVTMRTSRNGTLTPKDVFDRHSIEEFEFDRGTFRVSLVSHGREFISRSEAKRLAVGLNLYGAVELDFNGVDFVGQGFVDELFRVWVNANPGTEITYANANDAVRFMIERGLPRR